MAQPNITRVAIPVGLLQATIQTLAKMPYEQVGELVPLLVECMNDENKVNEDAPPLAAVSE